MIPQAEKKTKTNVAVELPPSPDRPRDANSMLLTATHADGYLAGRHTRTAAVNDNALLAPSSARATRWIVAALATF